MKPMKISGGKLQDYYYSKDPLFGQEKGDACSWIGTGAEKMGLTGKVDFENLINLAYGMDKDGTERLVGKETGPQAHHLNASTDTLLTLPKSFSILASYNPEFAADMAKCLKESAAGIEEYTYGRQTKDGVTEMVKGQLIGMVAIHSVNRNGDFHIHGHANALNTVIRPDQTYSTTENKPYFTHQGDIQQDVYSRIAQVAAQKYGCDLDLSPNKSGQIIPEIKGISQEMKDLSSSRQADIKNAHGLRAELREKMPNASEKQIDNLIQLQTKCEKNTEMTAADAYALRDAKTAAAGIDGYAVAASVINQKQHTMQMTAAEYISTVVKDLNENESKFSDKDVINGAAKLSVGDCVREQLSVAWTDAQKSGEVVKHGDKFTTPEMIKTEQGIADRAVSQAQTFTPLMTKENAEKEISKFETEKQLTKPNFKLSDGQAAAVTQVLTTEARLSLISGDAGSGKTTSFENVCLALKDRTDGETRDVTVIGLSNAGKGASQLQADSGIKSQTIASFLLQKDDPNDYQDKSKRELWIIDEASMMGSRQLSQLMDKAELRNAQLSIVGDGKQILAISAGQMFTDLQRLGLVEQTSITEVKRQSLNETGTNQYAIDSAAALRQHQPEKAFDILQSAGKITEVADRDERLKITAEKYIALNNQKETACIVSTNKDRRDLIEVIRDGQKQSGAIAAKDYVYMSENPISLTGSNRRYAASYEVGNYATLTKDIGIFKAGSKFEITGTDIQKQTITFDINSEKNAIKFDNKDRAELNQVKLNGETFDLNLKKDGNKISYSEMVETRAAEGEQLMLLKNDNTAEGKADGIKNGVRPIIQSINHETGDAVLQMENGKIIERNLNELPSTNGQVITAEKSQGLTVDNTIAMIESGMTNENKISVIGTRHRLEVEFITNDAKELLEDAKIAQVKESTLDGSDAPDKSTIAAELNQTLDEVNQKLDTMLAQIEEQKTSRLFDEPAATELSEMAENILNTEQSLQLQTEEQSAEQTAEQTADQDINQEQEQETDNELDDEDEPEQELKQEYELSM